MAQVTVNLHLPKDWQHFRLPPALRSRLQDLLDRQDKTSKLSRAERKEATALTQLVDMLSLLKVRCEEAKEPTRG